MTPANDTSPLLELYHAMLEAYGPQYWWPGETPFEIMVGAVLTQNTNWSNVEKAIANLKRAEALAPGRIDQVPPEQLAEWIRPAGYYNIKTKRLKNLVRWFCEHYDGSIEQLCRCSPHGLREELLAVNGIGCETADSILLYALEMPVFVVDTYTYRILVRHQLAPPEADYAELQDTCTRYLPEDITLYNECHALIVRVGKDHCKPRPRCERCPLNRFAHDIAPEG